MLIPLNYVFERVASIRYPDTVSLGQNIKRLRIVAGISTQKALADRLHVPQPQVSDWENDRYGTLETQTLMKLAKVLRCTIDQLLDGVDPDYDRVREAREAADFRPERIDYETDAAGSIPLVAEGSAAPAGTPWKAGAPPPGEIERWIPRPRDVEDPGAYGVHVRGDAMAPAYPPHTIAIVTPGRRVQDGDEAYVQLAPDERLIRLVRKTRGGYLLESYNHAYPARVVARRDVLSMHVILYSRRRDF